MGLPLLSVAGREIFLMISVKLNRAFSLNCKVSNYVRYLPSFISNASSNYSYSMLFALRSKSSSFVLN